MTPNRRVLLHIGSPKCGSTYLQRVMLKNQARLLAHGINYPHSGAGHPGNAANLADVTEKQLNTWFTDSHTVVLSHEDLLSQPARGKAFAELCTKAGIAVQVVSFIRPFCEFIYGDYSQFMKQNFALRLKDRLPYGGRNFQEFTINRGRSISAPGWLKIWEKLYADIPLRLESHRDIRKALQDLLDLPDGMDWTIHPDQVNRSLRVADCETLAAALMDTSNSDASLRAMFKDAFHKVSDPDPGRSPERDKWIEALFLDRNRAIFDHFGLDNRLDKSRPYR